MRTTIELPDAVFRRAKRVAADQGCTLKDLMTRAIERELATPSVVRERRPLPSIYVSADAPILHMTPDELAQADLEAEQERAHALPRRRQRHTSSPS